MISTLHRGGGSLGTPKSDYLIYARPLMPMGVMTMMVMTVTMMVMTVTMMMMTMMVSAADEGTMKGTRWTPVGINQPCHDSPNLNAAGQQ